jgi:hypothetical protein
MAHAILGLMVSMLRLMGSYLAEVIAQPVRRHRRQAALAQSLAQGPQARQ